MADIRQVQAGTQTIAVRKDLRVPMRDGVSLAADTYSGWSGSPHAGSPTLVARSRANGARPCRMPHVPHIPTEFSDPRRDEINIAAHVTSLISMIAVPAPRNGGYGPAP
jgi:predicted acyl esterase